MSQTRMAVRCEERTGGSRVILIKDGVAVLDLPWQKVDEVCKAMRAQAKLAEAADNREQVIADQAILAAFGARFGLSNDSLVQREAAKQAVDIRRKAGVGGVVNKPIVGTPAIVQDP